MIRINLLPVRAAKRQEAIRRQLMLAGMGLLAVIFLCGGSFVWVAAGVNEARASNDALKAEIANLKTIVAGVDEAEALREDLKKKLEVIESLRQKKQGPVRLLDELSNATPEKLVLTSLKETQGKIAITGQAVNNEVISEFLTRLEQSEHLDEVYLISIQQKDSTSKDKSTTLKLKEFSVTAKQVAPGTKKKVENSPDDLDLE